MPASSATSACSPPNTTTGQGRGEAPPLGPTRRPHHTPSGSTSAYPVRLSRRACLQFGKKAFGLETGNRCALAT